MEKEFERLWNRLKLWFNNAVSKHPITKEQFIELASARHREPDWTKCPPGVEDFPYDVQKALLCYGKFRDNIVPDIGYIGKDFTLFPIIVKVEQIENESLFLEALLQIDSLFIEKSRKDLEEARQQAKRRGNK